MIRAAAVALAALALCTSASGADQAPHLVWTARLSAPVGTPAVADGRIYVATGKRRTRLHALDAVTGRRLWQAIGGLGTRYAPLADTGLVLRMADGGSLRRYDPATGRIFWHRTGLFSEGFLAPPLLVSGRVLELSQSLDAVDGSTGQKLWSAPVDCFRCRVAADATRVYAAGKQGLRAFDTATGKVVWRTKGFAALDPVASLALAGGTIVAVETTVSGTSWSFFLEGFRATDGRSLWHTQIAATNGFDPWTAPVAGGGLVLYPAADGYLYALDMQIGKIMWRAPVGSSDSVPAVGNGGVWVVGDGNRLDELSLTTGATLWSGPAIKAEKDGPTPSPVIDGSLVLVGTAAGNLLAFG